MVIKEKVIAIWQKFKKAMEIDYHCKYTNDCDLYDEESLYCNDEMGEGCGEMSSRCRKEIEDKIKEKEKKES
jgi:hypothetical protein